jgi:hypothetical protein
MIDGRCPREPRPRHASLHGRHTRRQSGLTSADKQGVPGIGVEASESAGRSPGQHKRWTSGTPAFARCWRQQGHDWIAFDCTRHQATSRGVSILLRDGTRGRFNQPTNPGRSGECFDYPADPSRHRSSGRTCRVLKIHLSPPTSRTHGWRTHVSVARGGGGETGETWRESCFSPYF